MSIQDVMLKFRTVSAGSFPRTVRAAALIGILSAVLVPFFMLTIGGREANNMPWYVWTLIPLLLLMVIQAGILMYRHKSHHAEDISIRPKNTERR
jgi:phosphoglycerol transferase MdoB-like AlkP superfamily enzyme